jgi:hypothetical protein
MEQLLDTILGKDHAPLFRRAELKTLVNLHGNEVIFSGTSLSIFLYIDQQQNILNMIFGPVLVECITQCFTMFERVAAIMEAALGMQRSLLLVCCMT